jgi:hypothetical protein
MFRIAVEEYDSDNGMFSSDSVHTLFIQAIEDLDLDALIRYLNPAPISPVGDWRPAESLYHDTQPPKGDGSDMDEAKAREAMDALQRGPQSLCPGDKERKKGL